MGRARFDQGPLGWTMVGDFNEVLFPNERSRGGRLSNSMRRFSDIMNDLDLRDFLFRALHLERWSQRQLNVSS